MVEVTRKITVDLSRKGNVRLTYATQNDKNSRRLIICLTDGGKPYHVDKTTVALVNFARPDGESGAFSATVNDDGSISITLCTWVLTAVGEVTCSVSLFDGDEKKLTSDTFYIDVAASLYFGDDVTEDESYSLLTSLMSDIAEINEIEEARKVAESSRVSAEKSRVSTENARSTAEIRRVSAESERATAENARADAENARVMAEQNRAASENARDTAEIARRNSESARVIAENQRKTTIGEIENAVDEIIEVQNDILEGNAEVITREEIIAAINETMLIANDLSTDDPYKALSAAQGVILNGMLKNAAYAEGGYYNGTNTALSLTFSFVPKVVIIVEKVRYYQVNTNRGSEAFGIIFPEKGVIIRHEVDDGTMATIVNDSNVTVSLSGTTLSLTKSGYSTITNGDIFNTKSLGSTAGNASVGSEANGYGYWYYAIG